MLADLFYMLVFPGLLFLIAAGLAGDVLDRKLHARLQNRVGPPWYQTLADLIKLCAKQDLIPKFADRSIFVLSPAVALASTVTAFFYIPIWSHKAGMSFDGDIILVLYLLTVPTITFFLGGWYSRSIFSMAGAVRSIMQMFAYEIPLFLAILSSAVLANTWSLAKMSVFYHAHPVLSLVNVLGFCVAMVALLGKLEKVPFDIPEAETEIVAGSFTEYSGRLYALFRLAISIEMIVGASLLAAVFIPFGLDMGPVAGFAFYVLKVLGIICVMTLARSLFARLRIEQMINFFWKMAAPAAFAQLLINLAAKGMIAK